MPVFVGVGAPSIRGVDRARPPRRGGRGELHRRARADGRCGRRRPRSSTTSCASRRRSSLPVMIQDAPAYLGVGLGSALVQRVGAVAENVRLVKLEAGPAEMSYWFDDARRTTSRSGAGTAACTCSTACAAGPPGSSRASTSSTCSCRVYEAEARGETRARRRAVRARSCRCSSSRCSTRSTTTTPAPSAILVERGVLAARPGCARPPPRLGGVSRMLLERHLVGLAARRRRCPCRLTASGRATACRSRSASAASSPRCSPPRSSPAGSASARRFPSSEEIVNRVRRQPHRGARDRAGARHARAWCTSSTASAPRSAPRRSGTS